MSDNFRLLMLGAMYENGGNTTHRYFDGHPELFVYPFESQLGTRLVNDPLSSLFPAKYRWPEFGLGATPEQDYNAIIDEECRVRARTPHVSKFRRRPFEFCDQERKNIYLNRIAHTGRGRASNVAAFLAATFEAWRDYQRTGKERLYVGYSPIITVDAEKILTDFPGAVILHVVRNPWSAYADTRKRPVPLSLATYALGWSITQYFALLMSERFRGRVQIVRIEDVMANPVKTLGAVCKSVGVEPADSLKKPSWNGTPLTEIYPWGTIRTATAEANRKAAESLSLDERAEIRARTAQYLDVFDYKEFISS